MKFRLKKWWNWKQKKKPSDLTLGLAW
jgi:hypothetical protein